MRTSYLTRTPYFEVPARRGTAADAGDGPGQNGGRHVTASHATPRSGCNAAMACLPLPPHAAQSVLPFFSRRSLALPSNWTKKHGSIGDHYLHTIYQWSCTCVLSVYSPFNTLETLSGVHRAGCTFINQEGPVRKKEGSNLVDRVGGLAVEPHHPWQNYVLDTEKTWFWLQHIKIFCLCSDTLKIFGI